MATRKRSAPKGRGGRNDGRITEEQHEEAMRTLRAEYHQGVKSLVDHVASRLSEGGQDVSDIVHEVVDGSYWVIYTHANFQVLMCSDNHDAYTDSYGDPAIQGTAINWAALAFAAVEQDINERMQAEGVGQDVEEAPRRGRSTRESNHSGPRGLRRR